MESKDGKILISMMAANSMQYGIEENAPRNSSEVSITSLDPKISQFTVVIQKLAVGNMNQVRTCGIYTKLDHPMMCVRLYRKMNIQVNAIGDLTNTKGSTIHFLIHIISGKEIILISAMGIDNKIFS